MGILVGKRRSLPPYGCRFGRLSACDTAVGSLQGEEGIANLSLAFMLAGAKNVVSTLWSIDDTSATLSKKRFYTLIWPREVPSRMR